MLQRQIYLSSVDGEMIMTKCNIHGIEYEGTICPKCQERIDIEKKYNSYAELLKKPTDAILKVNSKIASGGFSIEAIQKALSEEKDLYIFIEERFNKDYIDYFDFYSIGVFLRMKLDSIMQQLALNDASNNNDLKGYLRIKKYFKESNQVINKISNAWKWINDKIVHNRDFLALSEDKMNDYIVKLKENYQFLKPIFIKYDKLISS